MGEECGFLMKMFKSAGHVFYDAVVERLGEVFETQDGDSWTIIWREVTAQGHYDEDSNFAWSAVNQETGASIGGDAYDDPDDAAYEIERLAIDPMKDVWVDTINECLAEDDWSGMRVSDDGLTVQAYDPESGVTRLATYGQIRFGVWRIGLLWAPGEAQWVPHAEMLPEDDDDIRADARKAYAWVKAVDS